MKIFVSQLESVLLTVIEIVVYSSLNIKPSDFPVVLQLIRTNCPYNSERITNRNRDKDTGKQTHRLKEKQNKNRQTNIHTKNHTGG